MIKAQTDIASNVCSLCKEVHFSCSSAPWAPRCAIHYWQIWVMVFWAGLMVCKSNAGRTDAKRRSCCCCASRTQNQRPTYLWLLRDASNNAWASKNGSKSTVCNLLCHKRRSVAWTLSADIRTPTSRDSFHLAFFLGIHTYEEAQLQLRLELAPSTVWSLTILLVPIGPATSIGKVLKTWARKPGHMNAYQCARVIMRAYTCAERKFLRSGD